MHIHVLCEYMHRYYQELRIYGACVCETVSVSLPGIKLYHHHRFLIGIRPVLQLVGLVSHSRHQPSRVCLQSALG